jgi:hypothetical protein
MIQKQTVVLYGDSLLMDAVEASLEEHPEIGIKRIHATGLDVEARLKSLHPDLFIFDLDAPYLQFIISFFRDQPNIPFLGLDICTNRVVVLSCQHYTTATTSDLCDLIQTQILSESTKRAWGQMRVFLQTPLGKC